MKTGPFHGRNHHLRCTEWRRPHFIHATPAFSMDETTISVARNGAGAKKCRGPAPGEITNKLSIRNISFYSGAGSHEKTAPAPALYLIAYP